MTHLLLSRILFAIAVMFAIATVWAWLGIKRAPSIEVNPKRCLETCIATLQERAVFTDFQHNYRVCNEMLHDVECSLVAKAKP